MNNNIHNQIIPIRKNMPSLASGGIEIVMQKKSSKTEKLQACLEDHSAALVFSNNNENFNCSLDFLCFVSCVKARIRNHEYDIH